MQGTELVYDGLTAGSWYDHTGGGANYICAVKDAKYYAGATTADIGYMEQSMKPGPARL